MEPISIAFLILSAIAAKAVVFAIIMVIFLTFEIIFNWFRDREEKIVSNPDLVPVTVIPNNLKNKPSLDDVIGGAVNDTDTPVIGGVFNTKKGKLEEAVVFKSKQVQEDVSKKHNKKGVVIYN
jgi:hypothetical protein